MNIKNFLLVVMVCIGLMSGLSAKDDSALIQQLNGAYQLNHKEQLDALNLRLLGLQVEQMEKKAEEIAGKDKKDKKNAKEIMYKLLEKTVDIYGPKCLFFGSLLVTAIVASYLGYSWYVSPTLDKLVYAAEKLSNTTGVALEKISNTTVTVVEALPVALTKIPGSDLVIGTAQYVTTVGGCIDPKMSTFEKLLGLIPTLNLTGYATKVCES